MRFRVGLTGGVASGKSTVCALFARLGVDIIDADRIARELLQPHTPCYRQVVASFGPRVVRADHDIDRAYLRRLIFKDPHSRQLLENILHPVIRAQLLVEAEQSGSAYCILAVPLLFEAGMADLVDRTLTVDAPVNLQLQRLCQRDQISRQQAQAMVDSQLPRQRRLQLSDDVIDNSGAESALATQVERLHERYLQLAATHR